MNIVMIGEGYGVGLAYDLLIDGHKVLYVQRGNIFETTPKIMETFGGSYKHYPVSDKILKEADVVIYDDIGFGKDAEKLGLERKIIGGNEYADRLEKDRDFMYEEARKFGMKVPEVKDFSSLSEGISFLESMGGKWVLKLSGKEGEENKWTTYVSDDDEGNDLIMFMEFLKTYFGKDELKYVLQEKKDGVEVALSLIGGNYFLNYEHKNLMRGAKFKTGEVGTLVKKISEDEGIVSASRLRNAYDSVIKHGYYNQAIDTNMIVNEEGAWFLEFTSSRFGYPISSIIDAMYKDNRGWMYKEWQNYERIKSESFTDKYAVGIVLFAPPFPYMKTEFDPMPVVNFPYGNHYVDAIGIYEDKEGVMLVGDDGEVGVFTGLGNTIEEANKNAVRRIKKSIVPLSFYRDDIGLNCVQDEKHLIEMGYLRDNRQGME